MNKEEILEWVASLSSEERANHLAQAVGDICWNNDIANKNDLVHYLTVDAQANLDKQDYDNQEED